MRKTITIIIITGVIVGGSAFYGGMKYSQSKSPFGSGGRNMQFGDRTGAVYGNMKGAARGGGFASGEVISKDGESVTVKTQNGGSKIIFVSSSTKVSKNADGSLDDVKVGTSISASGAANQDGSISAQAIQIRPAIEAPAMK